jgi:hypothetical protein
VTMERVRTTIARLGDVGEWLVVGLGIVGLPALLVLVAPTTNGGVAFAFFVGLVASSILISWITSSPMFWQRQTKKDRTWVVIVQFVAAFVIGTLLRGVAEQILPTTTGFDDHPGAVVVWLAVLWLIVGAIQLLWAVVKRLGRAIRPSADRQSA